MGQPGRPVPAVVLTPAELVLAAVAEIPAGRVMSYGDVAEYSGTRSARRVGRVLALHSESVPDLPWHRVVRADGTLATHKSDRQRERLAAEGVCFRGERVDMAAHRWDGS